MDQKMELLTQAQCLLMIFLKILFLLKTFCISLQNQNYTNYESNKNFNSFNIIFFDKY